MAFVILWGTLFPIISELIQGVQVTVGPPFFNRVTTPIGLGLLALTGIGPLIAWRKASTSNLRRQFTVPVGVALAVTTILIVLQFREFYAGVTLILAAFVTVAILQEFWRGVGARHRLHGESYALALARLFGRNRRRYGGYVVHLGIVAYFVGFVGMAFRTDLQVALAPGETATLASPFGYDYTFTHMGISQFKALNRYVTAATVDVRRDGKRVAVIRSEKRQHFSCRVAVSPCPQGSESASFQPSTEAGIHSDYREDIYVVFAGIAEDTEEAIYRFTLNPLVWWIWFGGGVLVVGGVIVMWPGGGPTRRAPRRTIAGYAAKLVDEREKVTA
jgi:cytochrome c-type biogenesis protein CcmF